MNIKKLDQDHWEEWKHFRLEALKVAPEAFGSSYHEERKHSDKKWKEDLNQNDIFGIFELSKLVAAAGFSQFKMAKLKHRAILFSVYTVPTHRRKGLSRALTEHVIKHAAANVSQIHLNCVTTNEAALQFYQSLGFKTYGTEPNALCVDGIYLDQYLMLKTL